MKGDLRQPVCHNHVRCILAGRSNNVKAVGNQAKDFFPGFVVHCLLLFFLFQTFITFTQGPEQGPWIQTHIMTVLPCQLQGIVAHRCYRAQCIPAGKRSVGFGGTVCVKQYGFPFTAGTRACFT